MTKQFIKNVLGYICGLVLIGMICFLVYVMGWTGFIIRFGLIVATPVLVILLIFIVIHVINWNLFYSKKEIGRKTKRFLGYNFGNEFEIIEPKDMTKKEGHFRFLIKIPQDTMQSVVDYCNSSNRGKCTSNGYVISKKYNSGVAKKRKQLEIKYDECTIEFIGL